MRKVLKNILFMYLMASIFSVPAFHYGTGRDWERSFLSAILFPFAGTAIVPAIEVWSGYDFSGEGNCRAVNVVENGKIILGKVVDPYDGSTGYHQRAFDEDRKMIDHTCPFCRFVEKREYIVKDWKLYRKNGERIRCLPVYVHLLTDIYALGEQYVCWALFFHSQAFRIAEILPKKNGKNEVFTGSERFFSENTKLPPSY